MEALAYRFHNVATQLETRNPRIPRLASGDHEHRAETEAGLEIGV